LLAPVADNGGDRGVGAEGRPYTVELLLQDAAPVVELGQLLG
jgi:hypothetical protein